VKAPDRMVSKAEATFEHPAKGPHHCSQCTHFNRGRCSVVRGFIEPRDWCRYWERK